MNLPDDPTRRTLHRAAIDATTNAAMSETAGQLIEISIDGRPVQAVAGVTILEAADAVGIYIPRLCHFPGLPTGGSCRLCTCIVNGRAQAACTQPVAPGLVIESDSERVHAMRKNLLEMMLVEGNHFCMFCEKSGHCELQALAYRFGITAPRHPQIYPRRELDATHPDVLLDRNRCILCSRCVRASQDLDGKSAFGFVLRGIDRQLAVNAAGGLGETGVAVTDRAIAACPVGALLPKRVGYQVPIGQRRFDHKPIGEP